jgi:hypothetical protein
VSFVDWMRKESHKPDVCCEYVSTLSSEHNVDQAKATLATLFDVVGITELMDEMLVDIARIFGASRPNIAPDTFCRQDSKAKPLKHRQRQTFMV